MREVGQREILVVDDDDSIREALSELLGAEGYHVVSASNGQEAVDLLQSGAVPSLIIIDLVMPVMDGREFCGALLQDPELAGIPVVLISADMRLTERIGELETAAIMTKPINIRALLETLEEHCPPQ
jgi:two-component system, chemotaxis family, chemotaxis protein CheY